MADYQESLSQKKTVFLIWVLVESFIFLFTELILEFLNKKDFFKTFYNDYHIYLELSGKSIQLFGFFVIAKIIYEINQMLAEPIAGFSQQVPKLQIALDKLDAESPIGFVKEITKPAIWEFRDNIAGWNPNWSIELSNSNSSSKKLKEIHKSRIISENVSRIQYIFFEDYKIDNGNVECFGEKFFLDFLKELYSSSKGKRNKKKLTEGVSKYEIWIIPKSIYTDNRHQHFETFDRYKDFIFLYGTDSIQGNTNHNMVIFINKKGFIVNNCHNYYLEIYKNNQIFTDLTSHFEHITQLLGNEQITPKKVSFNQSSSTFELG